MWVKRFPMCCKESQGKEDAVERLKFEKINNQIAFCTENALKQLTFVKSYTVEVE